MYIILFITINNNYFYFLDLFDNVVTFRKLDSQIRLPTFDFGQNGDIYFEFKTTIENAIIFESHGPKDFIKLSLISKKMNFLC